MDKHRVIFEDSNGRRVALELCCFCRKLTDLNHPETCVHFAEDYVDKSCSAFVQVDNVEKRLQESLAVKAVTPNNKCLTGFCNQ